MVFCYECDTLFDDLKDLSSQASEVNSFDESRPIFSCPTCGYEFEYRFMSNPDYDVPRAAWLAAGLARLLKHSA
jgi:transposase-like protein